MSVVRYRHHPRTFPAKGGPVIAHRRGTAKYQSKRQSRAISHHQIDSVFFAYIMQHTLYKLRSCVVSFIDSVGQHRAHAGKPRR